MRILVTGANGLVGSRLWVLLASRGHTVTALGRGPQRTSAPGTYRPIDLADDEALIEAVRAARPEVLMNPGAMTDVDACETAPEEAFRINVVAPGILAQTASKLGAHFVHVSTDYVFDGTAGPYTEEAVPNPRGVYALTKHAGEQAVRALAPTSTIARTAVVYGWPPAGRPNFGSWLISALRKGEPVRLFEDQYVSPSLVNSVAEQLTELAERRLGGVWNVAGAKVVNRVQFGRAVCREFGFDEGMIVPGCLSDAELNAPRPARSGLVTDKAAVQLAARPLALEAALERFHRDVVADERAGL